MVLAIDCDCEYFVVNELQQWNFFGLHHSNVVLLPLPRFHGFAQVGSLVAWRDADRAAMRKCKGITLDVLCTR